MSVFAIGLTILLAGCTLTRPQYATPDVRVGEPAFVRTLEAHTLSTPVPGNRAQVLLNGNEIFPAMLAAIRSAKSTITFANFIYEDGDISGELAAALAERCRAGVSVNVLVDAVGSSHMPRQYWTMLEGAGCQAAKYNSLNPLAIKRINHRNHRRILVVDDQSSIRGLLHNDAERQIVGRRAREFATREYTTGGAARYIELLDRSAPRMHLGAAPETQ